MSLKGQNTIWEHKRQHFKYFSLMLWSQGAPFNPYQFTAKTDKQEKHFIKEVIERGSLGGVFINKNITEK